MSAEECVRCGERYEDPGEPCAKASPFGIEYHVARRNAGPRRRCNATPDGKVFCESELGHKGAHEGTDRHGVLGPVGAKWTSHARLIDGRDAELVREQVAPTPSDRPAIWDLVIRDMHQRNVDGTAKYGTPLQAHNGRDALTDAYQEALDLCVYLRQAIEERKG